VNIASKKHCSIPQSMMRYTAPSWSHSTQSWLYWKSLFTDWGNPL